MSFVEHYRDFPGAGPKAGAINRISNNMDELNNRKSFYGAMLTKTSTQSFSTGTQTELIFQNTVFDTDSIVQTSGTKKFFRVPYQQFTWMKFNANIEFVSTMSNCLIQMQVTAFGYSGTYMFNLYNTDGTDSTDSTASMNFSSPILPVGFYQDFYLEVGYYRNSGVTPLVIDTTNNTWSGIQLFK